MHRIMKATILSAAVAATTLAPVDCVAMEG